MDDGNTFEFEGAASPAEAADTLTRIAEGIRARALSLSMGDEEITVYPDGGLALEIEAKDKKGKTRIEIAIAWRRPKDVGDDDQPGEPDMGKDSFEFARIATPEEIADYLTSLAVGLKRGEVVLESGDHALRLSPGADIKLQLTVKRKAGKGKIEIELGWKSGGAARAASLQIQAGVRTH